LNLFDVILSLKKISMKLLRFRRKFSLLLLHSINFLEKDYYSKV